jgi:hypothetical protein
VALYDIGVDLMNSERGVFVKREPSKENLNKGLQVSN